MEKKKKKQFTFREKPLFRSGNTLYYGEPGEKYMLQLDIIETKKVKDIESATKVKIKLIANTGNLDSPQVFRESERDDIYTALDIGQWWLKTALAQ
ncbi:MAG: hypothetical protein IJ300_00465 [Clostridia bacterium]|nr:hypothetical protein [Clostridia bacterium]